MAYTVITGGTVVTASDTFVADVLIDNGKIVALQGTQIELSLDGQARRVSMLIDLRLDAASGTATGTVSGQTTSAQ